MVLVGCRTSRKWWSTVTLGREDSLVKFSDTTCFVNTQFTQVCIVVSSLFIYFGNHQWRSKCTHRPMLAFLLSIYPVAHLSSHLEIYA